jgi:hypothetical protein
MTIPQSCMLREPVGGLPGPATIFVACPMRPVDGERRSYDA